jgi:hypothetical protein
LHFAFSPSSYPIAFSPSPFFPPSLFLLFQHSLSLSLCVSLSLFVSLYFSISLCKCACVHFKGTQSQKHKGEGEDHNITPRWLRPTSIGTNFFMFSITLVSFLPLQQKVSMYTKWIH